MEQRQKWGWGSPSNSDSLTEAGRASQSVPSFPSGSWLGLFLLIPCVEVDGTGRWDQWSCISWVLFWVSAAPHCTWGGASVLGQGDWEEEQPQLKLCIPVSAAALENPWGGCRWRFIGFSSLQNIPCTQSCCGDTRPDVLMWHWWVSRSSHSILVRFIFLGGNGCYSHSITVPCACGRNEATDSISYQIIIDKAWPSLSRPFPPFPALSPPVFQLYNG